MNSESNINNNFQIDFFELLKILWLEKITIILITGLFSIFAIIYSISLPNIYQSTALLSPVNEDNNNSNLKNLSRVANISLNQVQSNSSMMPYKALEKIKTLSFFEDHILPNIHLPNLMAPKKWDQQNNIILYEEDDYDENAKEWIRDVKFPKTQIPSAQESFERFIKQLEVVEDKETGFITISIEHHSPYIAKKWADLVVDEVDSFYKVKDKAEAVLAIKYLNSQIAKTNFAEIKEAIAELLQEKTKKLTLIEVSEYYVFDFIDPPAVMEKKHSPSRALICILITFFGGIISVFYVLIRHHLKD